jgi:hypothetical protein
MWSAVLPEFSRRPRSLFRLIHDLAERDGQLFIDGELILRSASADYLQVSRRGLGKPEKVVDIPLMTG